MRRLIYGAFGIAALLSGCSAGSFPSRIGAYSLDEGAREVFATYSTQVLKRDFEDAAKHVFSVVDNGDGVVTSDEAYEAINLIRPYASKFRDELLAIKAETPTEVANSE